MIPNTGVCHRAPAGASRTVSYYDPVRRQMVERSDRVPLLALLRVPRAERARIERHLGEPVGRGARLLATLRRRMPAVVRRRP